jgi:ankyrin repeat protein
LIQTFKRAASRHALEQRRYVFVRHSVVQRKDGRVDVNADDHLGRTALICASYRGHVAVVCELLKHEKLDVNAKDVNGRSAFFWVSYRGQLPVIHEFLKFSEVNVNVNVNVNTVGAKGNTALMWACLRGHSSMVSELLKFTLIDVHTKNKAGSTALDITGELELVEIAKCLEEHTRK